MLTTMLKAKLHRAHVTHSELGYEGSCAIDGKLLELAGIREYEQIEIYNVTNGNRFSTYAIRAEDGSGVISINGAAAHKADPDDIIIICAYTGLTTQELERYQPTLVYLEEGNRVTRVGNVIPTQAA